MEINDAKTKIIVELYLVKNNKILLQKRANTGYEDGNYGFISGHVKYSETLKQALIRETFEETGIILKEKDLNCVFIIHKTGKKHYINFIFKADKFDGTPKIKDKEKCSDLQWFDINNLPSNIISLTKQVIINSNDKNIKIIETII